MAKCYIAVNASHAYLVFLHLKLPYACNLLLLYGNEAIACLPASLLNKQRWLLICQILLLTSNTSGCCWMLTSMGVYTPQSTWKR